MFQDLPPDQSWANEMMVGLTAPDGSCMQSEVTIYHLNAQVPESGQLTGIPVLKERTWHPSISRTDRKGLEAWTVTILNSWDNSMEPPTKQPSPSKGCAKVFRQPGLHKFGLQL